MYELDNGVGVGFLGGGVGLVLVWIAPVVTDRAFYDGWDYFVIGEVMWEAFFGVMLSEYC